MYIYIYTYIYTYICCILKIIFLNRIFLYRFGLLLLQNAEAVVQESRQISVPEFLS